MILRVLFKTSNYLELMAKIVCIICLSLMTIIMGSEVIARNLFHHSITWASEMTTNFLGTWFIFIGASVPLKKGQLVSIQFIKSKVPEKASDIITILLEVMTLVFLAYVIRYGIVLTRLAMPQPSPALMWPFGYSYLGIVVGCCFMFYQTLSLILKQIFIKNNGQINKERLGI